MEPWVRFSAQSQAQERLFRAAQYACALAGETLRRNGASSGALASVQQLEAHLSLSRKLLRLGGWAEALEGAKRSLHLSDPVLRFCVTLANLTRALYLGCDNLLWAGRAGLLPALRHHEWSHRAFRYYLFSLLVNLTRDAYELRLLLEHRPEPPRTAPTGPQLRPFHHLRFRLHLLLRVLRENPPLLLDLLKNSCDLFIPLDKLGLYRTNPGFVGFCGLASSLLSILTLLHPWLKLKP